MRLFAFGILIFSPFRLYRELWAIAAQRKRNKKNYIIESKRDILYLKLHNNKIHQIIKQQAKAKQRARFGMEANIFIRLKTAPSAELNGMVGWKAAGPVDLYGNLSVIKFW